ncbi:M48 family metalloprotease [Candidatus Saccharibacteria bacterium]|nr:M48 family metalloprotease [Candidatus Saccharibacteria bacterium]
MYSEIDANKRKTVLLILGFVVFIGFLSYFGGLYYGDFTITIGALIGSIVYALFSYFGASKVALAFNGAVEIQKKDNPRLWRIVENIAITDGLPMPKVHIIEDSGLNAFATGRDPNHASVAITTGLLEILDDSELEGVMAHELGHVKNYDIRVSMIVFGLVMIVSMLSDIFLRVSWYGGRRSNDDNDNASNILMVFGIVAMILAPIIAVLIQSAISRKREYLADATGAMTTRYPEGLASALEKLRDNSTVLRRQNTSTAHLFFANPLKGKGITSMFSTHPPIEDRIAKLRSMGSKL